jgi:hypothetical protein
VSGMQIHIKGSLRFEFTLVEDDDTWEVVISFSNFRCCVIG